jgi:hypothetical protein
MPQSIGAWWLTVGIRLHVPPGKTRGNYVPTFSLEAAK